MSRLFKSAIFNSFLSFRAAFYADCVKDKSNRVFKCVGFVDATVLVFSRRRSAHFQKAAYKGHKCKHAMKYQALATSEGLLLHGYGSMKACLHDWTLHARNGFEAQLENTLMTGEVQQYIYGDPRLNHRAFLRVRFQCSSLLEGERLMDKAISSCRMAVE